MKHCAIPAPNELLDHPCFANLKPEDIGLPSWRSKAIHQENIVLTWWGILRRSAYTDGFAEVSSRWINQCGGRHYAAYLDWLIRHGFVETHRQYIVGSKSRSYRLKHKNREKRDFPVSMKRLRRLSRNSQESSRTPTESVTLRQLRNLTMDTEASRQAMSNLTWSSHYSAASTVLDFKLQDWWVKESEHTGRIYSSVTNMHKALRPCISWNSQRVVSLDVVNSQPLWLAALSPCDMFRKVVQAGTLYEAIQEFAGLDDRESAKKAFMSYAYGPHKAASLRFSGRTVADIAINANEFSRRRKRTHSLLGNPVVGELRSRVFLLFRDRFRGVHETLRRMKSGSKVDSYKQAALVLSRTEADAIIHKCFVPLANSGVPVLSIHDCLLTTPDCCEEVRQYLEDRLSEELTKKAGNTMTGRTEMSLWREEQTHSCLTQTTII